MRGVVYVDILFLVNAVIGLFLLRCTARLAGREYSAWRMALGGMMAGAASLALLLPPFPAVLVWGLKAAEACLIVLAAFPPGGLRCFFKTLWWYAALNVLLSGVVFAALYYGVAGGIEVNNMALYFNVPPLLLIACVAGVYCAVRVVDLCFGRPQRAQACAVFRRVWRHMRAGPCPAGHGLFCARPCQRARGVSAQPAHGKTGAAAAAWRTAAGFFRTGAAFQRAVRASAGAYPDSAWHARIACRDGAMADIGGKGEKTVHNALAVFTPERFADGAFSAIVSPALRGG